MVYKNEKLISVIIPTYNCSNTIENTINNVLSIKKSNIELIIIDSLSSDRTFQIINRYGFNIDLIIHEKDKGIYDAFNKGIINSSGKYVTFIGSGDFLTTNFFEYFEDFINNYPIIDYWSSDVSYLDRKISKPFRLSEVKKWMSVLHAGSVIKKDLFYKYGLFSNDYKIASDYEFLLRINNKANFGFIPFKSILIDPNGISNSNILLSSLENRKIKLLNKTSNILLINFEFILSIFKNYIRKLLSDK